MGLAASQGMNVRESVGDELRSAIAPLLSAHPPPQQGGHPWNPARSVLCGIAPLHARKGVERTTQLGRYRWVLEGALPANRHLKSGQWRCWWSILARSRNGVGSSGTPWSP